MATNHSKDSLDSRGLLFLNLESAGKLNDEFLPPAEFLTVRDKRYSDWPEALQTKLASFGAKLVALQDSER